jgi:hypothetical protein
LPLPVEQQTGCHYICLVMSTCQSALLHQGAELPLSGLMAKLATAEVLSNSSLAGAYKRRQVFVAFSGDPWGYMGSKHLGRELIFSGFCYDRAQRRQSPASSPCSQHRRCSATVALRARTSGGWCLLPFQASPGATWAASASSGSCTAARTRQPASLSMPLTRYGVSWCGLSAPCLYLCWKLVKS